MDSTSTFAEWKSKQETFEIKTQHEIAFETKSEKLGVEQDKTVTVDRVNNNRQTEDLYEFTFQVGHDHIEGRPLVIPRECAEIVGIEPGEESLLDIEDEPVILDWNASENGNPELTSIRDVVLEALCSIGSVVKLTFRKGSTKVDLEDVSI